MTRTDILQQTQYSSLKDAIKTYCNIRQQWELTRIITTDHWLTRLRDADKISTAYNRTHHQGSMVLSRLELNFGFSCVFLCALQLQFCQISQRLAVLFVVCSLGVNFWGFIDCFETIWVLEILEFSSGSHKEKREEGIEHSAEFYVPTRHVRKALFEGKSWSSKGRLGKRKTCRDSNSQGLVLRYRHRLDLWRRVLETPEDGRWAPTRGIINTIR